MTMFTSPDIIACPTCEQHFLRRRLCSFNNKWEVTYSDGGSSYGIDHIVFDATRCTSCRSIILGVQNLPSLGILEKPPFWKRWFTKEVEHLYLPHPTSDVYLELFETSTDADEKMRYAVTAYRVFNRTYRLEDKNTQPSTTEQKQYREAGDYILASPPADAMPEYHLLCADIYRQRGLFERAIDAYAKVGDPKLQYIVEQGITWAKSRKKKLMVIKSQEQHTAQNTPPKLRPNEKVVCNIEVKKECSKRWEELFPIAGNLHVKFCDTCNQKVHHCGSIEEFKFHSYKQHCIAADIEALEKEAELTSLSPATLTIGMLDFAKYDVNTPNKKKNDES